MRRCLFLYLLDSHDQGWSDYRRLHGTYNGCWSWFEADVYNASTGTKTARVKIQDNLHAIPDFTFHKIIWHRENCENKDIERLIDALVSGATLRIFAKARFGGWANYVMRVQVTIVLE
ncbi:heterokaryon incompatibility [Pyrenophora seminiperda CCB06]|uniref:Heterokaryon incompatibility n=1 Tax=Pyrenophora seminiperda CCB06 TaxID=1302712 RepID=A0A3M7M1G3_9PLEO|nr:heterokaryon incompatibility [Pyrenophora seminiperda CCB06]